MAKRRIAIIGAGELAGEELLEALDTRGVPVADVRLLTSTESISGKEFSFGEHSLRETLIGEKAFAGVSVAIFAAGPALARKWARVARDAGCWVIDATGALDEKAPAIVPALNAEAIPDRPATLVSPSPAVVALALVLAPLHQAAGLHRVVVSTYHGASGLGSRGMDELVAQTREILGGSEPEPESFPHRLAFNVIPQSDAFETEGPGAGQTGEEARIARDLPRLLGAPELAVSATVVRVPIFTGVGLSVNVSLAADLPPEKARDALSRAPDVQVLDEPSFHLYPLIAEIIGRDGAYVGRIRTDPTVPHGLCFWVAFDDLRSGVGFNVAGIVEQLSKRGRSL